MRFFVQVPNSADPGILDKYQLQLVINAMMRKLFTPPIANRLIQTVHSESRATKEALFKDLVQELRISGDHVTLDLTEDMVKHASETEPEKTVIRVPSSTRYGLYHQVTLEDGQALTCSCEAGVHGKTCKHLLTAEALHRSDA